jgi:cytochrome c biogenesis protein CcmG, thiol:disulfide interchange protein DsbE
VRRRASWSLAVVLLLTGVVAACSDDGTERLSEDMEEQVPQPGERADGVLTVEYETPDGGRATLADYAGAAMVVNFFASTCVPCVTEMPEFEGVHQELGDTVTFVGIAVQDPADDAADLVARTGVTYDYGLDPDGALFVAMGGVALPTTALVRPDGTVADVRTGAVSDDKLRDLVREHLDIG